MQQMGYNTRTGTATPMVAPRPSGAGFLSRVGGGGRPGVPVLGGGGIPGGGGGRPGLPIPGGGRPVPGGRPGLGTLPGLRDRLSPRAGGFFGNRGYGTDDYAYGMTADPEPAPDTSSLDQMVAMQGLLTRLQQLQMGQSMGYAEQNAGYRASNKRRATRMTI